MAEKNDKRSKKKLLHFRRIFVILLILIIVNSQKNVWSQGPEFWEKILKNETLESDLQLEGQDINNLNLNPYPLDPEEADFLDQMKIITDAMNNIIDDLIFYSFASSLPLNSSVSSYGSNEIGLMAPNPYFHLSIASGVQLVMPILNYKMIKSEKNRPEDLMNTYMTNAGSEGTSKYISEQESPAIGPLAFIEKQKGYGIGLPSAMVFFSLRMQITLGLEILDRMQFGFSYSSPKIPAGKVTKPIGESMKFPYNTNTTLYSLSLRYKVFEDPIASIAIGTSFNYLKFAFEASIMPQSEPEWLRVANIVRTRRAQTINDSADFNRRFPTLGPYQMLFFYQTKNEYYMSSLDFFMRTDFGVPMFRPFIDFGLTVKLSEILKHSSGILFLIKEPTSIDPTNPTPAGRSISYREDARDKNILLLDYHPYNHRKSGVSAITPRISVGFNALYLLNFHASITFLRAASPVPALSLSLFINLDF